jgi:hypothetical protein
MRPACRAPAGVEAVTRPPPLSAAETAADAVGVAGWAVVAAPGCCARMSAAGAGITASAGAVGVRAWRRAPPAACRAAGRPRRSRRSWPQSRGCARAAAQGASSVPWAARGGQGAARLCGPVMLGMTETRRRHVLPIRAVGGADTSATCTLLDIRKNMCEYDRIHCE